MVTITCYGGAREIGGNKVLLEDGETHLFLDFGISFARRGKYFEEYLKPRPGRGLVDLLRLGLLPPLGGIYREDLFPGVELRQWLRAQPGYRELRIGGVLLSHAHVDHSGYISFLDEGIPIYSSAMSAFISKAVQDTGTDFEREICYLRPREMKEGVLQIAGDYRQRPYAFMKGELVDGAARAFWDTVPGVRRGLELSPVLPPLERIAGLRYRAFAVDHSIFGALGFAIETSHGWVGYTGDLRLHGGQAHLTAAFIEELGKLHPIALFCEGTRIDSARRIEEREVYLNALAEVRRTKGLVVADFGPRNAERLLIFHHIAQATGRKLIVLPKDAYLLDAMRLASPAVPNIEAIQDILIYADPRARLEAWEKELRQRYASKMVGPEEVRAQQGECILCFSFWDVNDLLDIEPREATYIYSSSEAYNEEQEMDLWRLGNWLEHLGMRFVGNPMAEPEAGLHSSGHASREDLVEMVRHIQPRCLIPIHTEKPEEFCVALAADGIEVKLPKEGEPIEL